MASTPYPPLGAKGQWGGASYPEGVGSTTHTPYGGMGSASL